MGCLNRADKYFEVPDNLGSFLACQDIVVWVAFEDCFLVVEVEVGEADEEIVVYAVIAG